MKKGIFSLNYFAEYKYSTKTLFYLFKTCLLFIELNGI